MKQATLFNVLHAAWCINIDIGLVNVDCRAVGLLFRAMGYVLMLRIIASKAVWKRNA